ncbi:hypothetical protein [Ensifer sp. 4252]|uniref:hypothetical protein n=1 Tax=Ensifer sp. 4252 TaxID=3373915 RepID=UPI003D21C60D
MFDRTNHRSIHFNRPFRLPDTDEIFAAGDYDVDEDEILIEGLSRLAYRRVATFIKVPATIENQYRMRLLAIEPEELDRIIKLDGGENIPASHPHA